MASRKRKFSEVFIFCLKACAQGICPLFMVAKMFAFPPKANTYLPSFHIWTPVNAGVSRRSVRANSSILCLLRICALPKIAASIIERISVPMVDLYFWISDTKDKTVHSWSTVTGSSVERLGSWMPKSIPRAFHDAFVVACINNRDLTFRQRNESDILVSRLNNRFAGNAILGHDLSITEIAVFDRSFILPKFSMSGGI